MQKLSDIQEARLKLDTDVADQLGRIRNLIIRAEDCRINDMLVGYNCISAHTFRKLFFGVLGTKVSTFIF